MTNEKPKTPANPENTQKNKQADNEPIFKITKFEAQFNPKKFFSRGMMYLFFGLLFLPFLISIFTSDPSKELSMSQLISDIRSEQVVKLSVAGDQLIAKYQDGTEKIAQKEGGQEAVNVLKAADIDLAAVDFSVEKVSFSQIFWQFVLSLAPFLIMIAVFMFLFRPLRGGPGGIMGFGKSKAKIFLKGKQDTKFSNVGGMEEAKKELEEIVDFLKNPKKYQKIGARTPKGVLLVGPAGTGKTLLARAVAGEANVQFLSIAGSEFIEMLVGVGASRVRDLFDTAKKISPSIIFIDEIDAIGRARGRNQLSSHDEREQTLNQILVEMDGFNQNDNVIVMAATNRGDMLDPALVRPGRFDRRVVVRLPDLEERKNILQIHAKGKPFAKKLDWDKVAKRTVGFSGADIENMLNEAAIAVARDNRLEITNADIEEASLKVKLGPSKRRLQDKHEREMTAYHEAGHAVLAHLLPHADPVHRISIVSRGRALGFTLTPPEKDKLQVTKSELLDQIVVFLGGRAAEKLIFDELTAGASNDIEQATRIARAMVMDYGMSSLGPVKFSPSENGDYQQMWDDGSRLSENMREKVDDQINQLIELGTKKADSLLKKYHKQLELVSQKLLEMESLDGDEFAKLMGVDKAKHVRTDSAKSTK